MAENLFVPDKIRTHSGIYIDPFNPKPEEILIEDIAHALSHAPRFGGHMRKHYSVALHSLWVCGKCSDQNKLEGLLHDATEAYLADIPTPIKSRLPDYKNLEESLMKAIYDRFSLPWPMSDEVKHWDREALVHEWDNYVLGKMDNYIPSEVAKSQFLLKFYQLTDPEKYKQLIEEWSKLKR